MEPHQDRLARSRWDDIRLWKGCACKLAGVSFVKMRDLVVALAAAARCRDGDPGRFAGTSYGEPLS
jgi:hypothetical protein